MGLDLSKLEMVKPRGPDIVARCPACAESGNDRKGEHLYVYADGRFGCVIYPAADGKAHRQRIFELAGMEERRAGFRVNQVQQFAKQPIIKNVLGHLGRLNLTFAYKEQLPLEKDKVIHKDEPKTPVPAVPAQAQDIFSKEELAMLKDIDPESLQSIADVKRIFSGTVVRVTDKTPNDLGNS